MFLIENNNRMNMSMIEIGMILSFYMRCSLVSLLIAKLKGLEFSTRRCLMLSAINWISMVLAMFIGQDLAISAAALLIIGTTTGLALGIMHNTEFGNSFPLNHILLVTDTFEIGVVMGSILNVYILNYYGLFFCIMFSSPIVLFLWLVILILLNMIYTLRGLVW